ncbi:class 3 adenylate cyclase [Roseimicrobium gellanilyticum]|uniref:Class 3 adenylate cyclase n=1 Tax=Roseimicrobium gellanilyticum TaxID=748857 RepID=A0A366HFD0_9BACT|nr:adenylate/guanylate cyclase domain-containing protein [Roseimicrobium gellanilyticum]RBP41273.1 class 3 adenylate cyclase [Roseimicrobium gellanilyticum]
MELRAIMFVDMVDSTGLKHRESSETALLLTKALFEQVKHATKKHGSLFVKFTGDGAMVTFAGDNAGCFAAIQAARVLVRSIDEYNLQFNHPSRAREGAYVNIRVRIGIAFGRCDLIEDHSGDVVGLPADLAARLCREADINRILLDRETMMRSGMDLSEFDSLARRRLALKGIPLPGDHELEQFFHVKVPRLVQAPLEEDFPGGMVAVYTNRNELRKDFSLSRVLDRAVFESQILVVGRTLVGWSQMSADDLELIRTKKLRLRLLVSSQEACKFLAGAEVTTIAADKAATLPAFERLTKLMPSVDFHEMDILIPDGFTCVEVSSGGEMKSVVLRDINSGAKTDKITMLFACICDRDPSRQSRCITCGMRERARRLAESPRGSAARV